MDPDQPATPDMNRPPAPAEADAPAAYDRFVDGQAALEEELGEAIDPPPPSRRSAWLAMGAVGLALGLLWLAPGITGEDSEQNPTQISEGGASGEEGNPKAGAAAVHHEGHERHRREARVVQGEGDPPQFLGDMVRTVPRRDSRARRSAAAIPGSARRPRCLHRRSVEQAEAVRDRDAHELPGPRRQGPSGRAG